MALKPTETITTEPQAEPVREEVETPELGIHVVNADGVVIAANFVSVEAAQSHIDGHLNPDCTVAGV